MKAKEITRVQQQQMVLRLRARPGSSQWAETNWKRTRLKLCQPTGVERAGGMEMREAVRVTKGGGGHSKAVNAQHPQSMEIHDRWKSRKPLDGMGKYRAE